MRRSFSALCLVLLLGLTIPAQAQLRSGTSPVETSVRLYDAGQAGFSLNKYFSPEHFRMSHSLEMSASSFNGGSTLGMYTNSMMWQFNSKLAARADVSVAYGQSGASQHFSATGGQSGQVFLRNAEIQYRPRENMQIHLQVRQSPYGSYMNPYGYRASAYDRSSMSMSFGPERDDLFWNDRLK